MFGKIFRQIYESSIAEDPELRFTFMDLIVLADSDGVVDMTQEAIARITNRPLDLIRRTISELEAPDRRSRTPDYDGRRLRRIDEHRDWGWIIVNYDRFRRTASEEQRREKTRERVARFRDNRRNPSENDPEDPPVTQCNACNAKDNIPLPLLLPGIVPEGGTGETKRKDRGTYEEVVEFTRSLKLPDSDAVWFFNKCEGNGWKNNKQQIKDWRATIRAWQAAGYMPSQRQGMTTTPKGSPQPDPRAQLKALEEAISRHPANRSSIYHRESCSQQQREEYRAMKAKRDALQRIVGAATRTQEI